LNLEANSAEEARSIAQEASEKLLANPVMEEFTISIAVP
jgi:phosphoribosylformylglycinamidine synthase